MTHATLRAASRVACSCLLALLLAACASSSQGNALDRVQYAYSAAIRWGDFEGAWQLVDPEYRDAHPLTDIELARYEQVQVTAYRDLASTGAAEGVAMREIEIGIVNRHTLVERNVRYTERWRYDPEAGTWWLAVGLPDFWQGR
jgi:hypothetical protein